MPISFSTHANYVTQQGMWGTQFGKTLTDRRITHYQKLGYYSNGVAKANFKNEKQATRKRVKIELLFKGF
jgi:hypothetical protein